MGIVVKNCKGEITMTTPPVNWPFQFYNNQCTPESKALTEKRYTLKESNVELHRKEDLSTIEDALF